VEFVQILHRIQTGGEIGIQNRVQINRRSLDGAHILSIDAIKPAPAKEMESPVDANGFPLPDLGKLMFATKSSNEFVA
jgi:hypothetical protein